MTPVLGGGGGAVAGSLPEGPVFSPARLWLAGGGDRKANKRKLNFGHVKKDNTQSRNTERETLNWFSLVRHLNNIFSETFAAFALKTKPLHKEGQARRVRSHTSYTHGEWPEISNHVLCIS